MTEAEWQTSLDTEPMLTYLRAASVPYSDRRFRLFALACCVRLRRFFIEPPLQEALAFLERYAEHGARRIFGRVAVAESVRELYAELDRERNELFDRQQTPRFCHLLILIGSCLAAERLLSSRIDFEIDAVCEIVADSTAWETALSIDPDRPPLWDESRQQPERAAQAALVREVFGNPFRPVSFRPGWRSETVVLLADGIHADRAYDRLPILADALEEAGCENADVLTHCRGPGPHVFGCWALDLVRGCY